MPDKRKSGPSKYIILAIILIAVILVTSYGLVLYLNNGPTEPQPSSFVATEWMSLIPQNVITFTYFDIHDLANVTELFPSSLFFSIENPALNITSYNTPYIIFLGINAFALSETTLSAYGTALQSSNLTSIAYGNVTFYKLGENNYTQNNEAWVCVDKGFLILATGNDTAVDGLKSVVDATSGSFFSTDSLKEGYLLAKENGPILFYTYQNPGSNSYNVSWIMDGVTNGTSLDDRAVFNFPSTDIMNSQYDNVKNNILTQDMLYNASSYSIIYGDVTYPSSDLVDLLQSKGF